MPHAIQDLTPVATLVYSLPVIPANSGSQCFPPGLPFPNPSGVAQDEARTRANSFSPDTTPHSAYTTPGNPSVPSGIRGHRAETESNILDATPGAAAWGAHTPSTPPRFVLHSTDVLESDIPQATHDASSMPTAYASHTGTISADMQSVGDVPAVSQQSILISPPSRAVLKKDDRHLDGPLVHNIHDTALTSDSSTASSIPEASGIVSALPHSPTATPSSRLRRFTE